MFLNTNRILGFLCLLLVCSCSRDELILRETLFSQLDPTDSQVTFENRLAVNDSMNFFKYGYFYMGGGVAAGDLNGDDLPDLFFTSNMESNACFINQGKLTFEDITDVSGLNNSGQWHTGCNFHDFNNDGKLDIYVSVAGIWASRKNKLYINQGNTAEGIPIFKEQAEAYGLADEGYSIQSTYLDYDNDGDLDIYVVNYPPVAFNTKVKEYKYKSDHVTLADSDHLYRNNGDGSFTDVTEAAGVLRFGLGIGVVASDFNQDGLTDLYVSNDFHTPDFFFINNGDGTFSESLRSSFAHTSFYGMGVDAADMNNDALIDLFQVDMTTTDNYRSKANMSSMNIPAFWAGVDAGFHYQYMYNSLQLNNGFNPEGQPYFSDIAMANDMHATEWSWACLIADYDNDGLRDVFVSNGSRKEINNKDYFKWLNRTDTKLKVKYKELNFAQLTEKLPSVKTDNYIYKNQGGTFTRQNNDWGLKFEGYSNGSTHADLDGDGDLELIINNIDSAAVIFENNATQLGTNYLRVSLKGPAQNPLALGSKIMAYANGETYYYDHTLVRGYQSSVETVIHFGLDSMKRVDSLVVIWPNQTETRLSNINANQTVSIEYKSTHPKTKSRPKTKTLFSPIDNQLFDFTHKENVYDDYKREVLLPHKMSSFGPKVSYADFNADGEKDLVVTGAKDQASRLFLSNKTGNQTSFNSKAFDGVEQEDVNIQVSDINQDGQLDILFSSGGNEMNELTADYYAQRHYLNDGDGKFSTSQMTNAQLKQSAALSVDIELTKGKRATFFAARQIPGHYPSAPQSFLIEDGVDITEEKANELKRIGMITDALATDYDGDGDEDLILTGEWMGLLFFNNQNGRLEQEFKKSISDQVGWWKDLALVDIDDDGDLDIICGNLGTNYKYKASDEATFDIYAKDFDNNNAQDIVLSFYQEGDQFPVRGRQCSSEQMPALSEKFPNYHTFASSNLKQIYGEESLQESTHYKANQFRHAILLNEGKGDYRFKLFPAVFQRYSVNAIATADINQDGHQDIIMAGNIFDSEVETPRSDSGYGVVGLGDGQGNFNYLSNHESGLYIPYECQDLQFIEVNGQKMLLAAVNDGPLLLFAY